MIRRASRISTRRGPIGRVTRGVVAPRAQVTSTGMVANVEASADRGTSTLQLETTVALTMRGADVDWAPANVGPPATIAAARTVRITAFHSNLADASRAIVR